MAVPFSFFLRVVSFPGALSESLEKVGRDFETAKASHRRLKDARISPTTETATETVTVIVDQIFLASTPPFLQRRRKSTYESLVKRVNHRDEHTFADKIVTIILPSRTSASV